MAQVRDTGGEQLKKKLAEILVSLCIETNRLHALPDCYKLKLRSSGYRLVYQVIDQEVVVFVVAVAVAVAALQPIAGGSQASTKIELLAPELMVLKEFVAGVG